MIEHHLDDDLLVGYAAGTLSEGWSIGVAAHLSLCPSCRQKLALMESLGGHFLECEDVATDENADWARMRERLRPGDRDEAPMRATTRHALLPGPLDAYIAAAGGLRWRNLGRGAAQMKIQTSDRTTTVRLLKIPAGQPVPEHSHRGLELTLVLSGSFHDARSTFRRGDVELADDDLLHQPVASPQEDCICLAITEAPLRFTSRLMRIVQPLLGI